MSASYLHILLAVAAATAGAAGGTAQHSMFGDGFGLFDQQQANVPAEFDCGMAKLAIRFAAHIHPGISAASLQEIADALNGRPEAQCRNVSSDAAFDDLDRRWRRSAPPKKNLWRRKSSPAGPLEIVVAPDGNDANAGTVMAPKKSIQAAIVAARGGGTVKLRGGVYMEGSTIQIEAADKGLTLTNWPGETVTISGGKVLPTSWKPYKVAPVDSVHPGSPCRMVEDPGDKIREGGDYLVLPMKSNNISECIAACCAHHPECVAASFNLGKGCEEAESQNCCHLKRELRPATGNKYGPHVRTVYNPDVKPRPSPPPFPPTPPPLPPAPPTPPNIYVTDVAVGLGDITGLRVANRRAIRARFPNANTETAGMHTRPTGWVEAKTQWLPPKHSPPPVEIEVTDPRWRRHDSTGNELGYQGGVGGACAHLDPPFGYWCSNHPNRTVSGALTHRSPSGVVYGNGRLLPHAPYERPVGAVVHSCRGGANCWYTWMFEVDAAPNNDTLSWTFGGFQGAEGSDAGGVWYIENVFEELDWPTEYFFDKAAGKLYYFQNATEQKEPPTAGFVATDLKVLINISGTQAAPVQDITITGITFRDAAYTFMDPHGMPSGGDWCLQHSGAIMLVGTEDVTLENNTITRVDGNAIFVGAYNRRAKILNSEFNFIGDTAVALWGKTEALDKDQPQPEGTGINGTGGNQPRFTEISGNIIHEIGHFQKQSSMVFQAQSCQTNITKNIFYNGPRANINFNDQFGGDNHISENLIFNSCRETADHGPFNSWGRQVYITEVRDGKTASITPAPTEIERNFVISNYHGHEAIDNDDASEYFNTHHNFFVYGANGLKSDFEGHDNLHHNNLYAYISGTCFGIGSFIEGHEDGFFNNTCIATRHGNFDCKSAQLPLMHDNTLYLPSENLDECGLSLSAWQRKGHNLRTTVSTTIPTSSVLLEHASSLLMAN